MRWLGTFALCGLAAVLALPRAHARPRATSPRRPAPVHPGLGFGMQLRPPTLAPALRPAPPVAPSCAGVCVQDRLPAIETVEPRGTLDRWWRLGKSSVAIAGGGALVFLERPREVRTPAQQRLAVRVARDGSPSFVLLGKF